MRRSSHRTLGAVHQVLAALTALALITLQVRHGFHRGDFELNFDRLITLYEIGTYAAAWLALGYRGVGHRALAD